MADEREGLDARGDYWRRCAELAEHRAEQLTKERDEWFAEVERLRESAHIARERAGKAREALERLLTLTGSHSGLPLVSNLQARQVIRAALGDGR